MSDKPGTSRLRVLTWNLRWSGGRNVVAAEADALAELAWDVALLQEVNPRAWQALNERELSARGVSAFDFPDKSPDGKRPHGVAMLVRGNLGPADIAPLTGLPRPGRGIGATLTGWEVPVSVCSWHAPNAASVGPAIKMQGYLAFLGWIARQRRPTIVGFDANHWEVSTELELQTPDDPAHGWYLENRFFGGDPPHGLRDAFRDYLTHNPDEYRRLLSERPSGGSLATTYVRGSKAAPVEDRFDYILMSDEFACLEIEHDYERGVAAGSDHAVLRATLGLF
jgi:endonuclease/exonuclease/phosphatase family metal-dependent hydrolase